MGISIAISSSCSSHSFVNFDASTDAGLSAPLPPASDSAGAVFEKFKSLGSTNSRAFVITTAAKGEVIAADSLNANESAGFFGGIKNFFKRIVSWIRDADANKAIKQTFANAVKGQLGNVSDDVAGKKDILTQLDKMTGNSFWNRGVLDTADVRSVIEKVEALHGTDDTAPQALTVPEPAEHNRSDSDGVGSEPELPPVSNETAGTVMETVLSPVESSISQDIPGRSFEGNIKFAFKNLRSGGNKKSAYKNMKAAVLKNGEAAVLKEAHSCRAWRQNAVRDLVNRVVADLKAAGQTVPA